MAEEEKALFSRFEIALGHSVFGFKCDDHDALTAMGIQAGGVFFDVATLPWILIKRAAKPNLDVWHFLRHLRRVYADDADLSRNVFKVPTAAFKDLGFTRLVRVEDIPPLMIGSTFAFRRARSVTLMSLTALFIHIGECTHARDLLGLSGTKTTLELLPDFLVDEDEEEGLGDVEEDLSAARKVCFICLSAAFYI